MLPQNFTTTVPNPQSHNHLYYEITGFVALLILLCILCHEKKKLRKMKIILCYVFIWKSILIMPTRVEDRYTRGGDRSSPRRGPVPLQEDW